MTVKVFGKNVLKTMDFLDVLLLSVYRDKGLKYLVEDHHSGRYYPN